MEGYHVIIEQFPSNELVPQAINSIQQTLLLLDRDIEAISIADNFISNNPGSPYVEDFKFKKAEMFYTGRRYADAIAEYDDYARRNPESSKTPEALY